MHLWTVNFKQNVPYFDAWNTRIWVLGQYESKRLPSANGVMPRNYPYSALIRVTAFTPGKLWMHAGSGDINVRKTFTVAIAPAAWGQAMQPTAKRTHLTCGAPGESSRPASWTPENPQRVLKRVSVQRLLVFPQKIYFLNLRQLLFSIHILFAFLTILFVFFT